MEQKKRKETVGYNIFLRSEEREVTQVICGCDSWSKSPLGD